jgi:hypothetical protein
MEKEIDLQGILSVLETYDNNKSLLFVNPDGNLETFFTYKGTLVEINKMHLRKLANMSTDKENEEKIRENLVYGIQMGYWLVFNMGSDSKFNLDNFFKSFSFYNKNTWYNFQNYKDKGFMIKSGLLKNTDDKDVFGNSGGYTPHDTFKICYLCSCPINELETLKKNIDPSLFDIYIVK